MKKSTRLTLSGIVAACLMLLVGILWFRHYQADSWIPVGPEPKRSVFFETKWGFMGVGIYRASGKGDDCMDDGFKNFYVRGNKVYIADIIKREISVFENNKLQRAYEYPHETHKDRGIAVTDDFIYLLDDKGYIIKINLSSGAQELRKRVLIGENEGILAENEYTLYMLDKTVVAQGLFNRNRCFAAHDLSEVPCPFKQREDPSNKIEYVYLSQGYYAGVVLPSDDVWLHDPSGKKTGHVRKDEVNLLFDAGKNYQINLDGIYYAEHFEATDFNIGVRIYFKPWQK